MSERTIAIDEPLSKRELAQVIETLRGPEWTDDIEHDDATEIDATGWSVDRDGKDGEVTVIVKFYTNRRAEIDEELRRR